MSGLQCPKCDGPSTVLDVRQTGGRTGEPGSFNRRRKKCDRCDFRFTTYESLAVRDDALWQSMMETITLLKKDHSLALRRLTALEDDIRRMR